MDKLFSCTWGSFTLDVTFYPAKHSYETIDFFNSNNGYGKEDIQAINALELGAEYKLQNHRIMRVE